LIVKSYSHIRFCCVKLVLISYLSLISSLTLDPMDTVSRKKYWKKNIRILLTLLAVWFIVSFGFGILLVEQLNQIKMGGFKLGFWFAQQGSIYFFVALIFIYVVRMNMLDKEFNVNEE
jgi:putative solute:sodium symporter small subunit